MKSLSINSITILFNPITKHTLTTDSMQTLFKNETSGAAFSDCKNYRFALWRIWDDSKPYVMFIGLNPSTANETTDDATIRRVKSISNNLGYGGFYMMNCFPFVSTDPKQLYDCSGRVENDNWLSEVSAKCKDIVFAWGNFEVVRRLGVDHILSMRFPNAYALQINKNGSPKHPLYVKGDIKPVKFNN